MTAKYILGAAAAVFVIGGSVIVYYGRPVMNLPQNDTPTIAVGEPNGTSEDAEEAEEENEDNVVPAPVTPKPTPAPTPAPGTYTLATVAAHNTQADCWSAVNGSVYDLTTWVARHPGGAKPILNMCGTDASAAFTRQHGSGKKPQAALILLKIGALQS